MLALCREHRLEHRTKHIALRYFLARELQQRGQLRLAYVASEANTADIFTKALAPGDHQRFCTLLGFPTSAPAARAPPLTARALPLQPARCPCSPRAAPAACSRPCSPRASPGARERPLKPARRPHAAPAARSAGRPAVCRLAGRPSRAQPCPALRASLELAHRPACVLLCLSHATLLCPLWILSVYSPSIMRA
ncbi:unnamed protein product, partial [Closterium sp. NIES-54]